MVCACGAMFGDAWAEENRSANFIMTKFLNPSVPQLWNQEQIKDACLQCMLAMLFVILGREL